MSSSDSTHARGVIFDVDGTLLDTNYLHAVSWSRAFREAGHDVDMADIHRMIGRASEDLVEQLIGTVDDRVVEGHSARYDDLRDWLEPRPLRGAPDLVRRCAESGLRVVIATSGSAEDLDWMLPAIGVQDLLAGTTTSAEVERSKPAPDLLGTALRDHDLRADATVAVGDTVYDVESARRLGIPVIGLASGGISGRDLREAGADEVYDGPADLLAQFESSLLAPSPVE